MMRMRAVALVVVLMASSVSAPQLHAQRLGRLFTTPEQRSALDEIRTQAQFDQPELEPEPEPEMSSLVTVTEQPRGPTISNLTINGVVRRSGGRTTVWVNGHEVDRGDVTREGVLVESATRRSEAVRLRLPSGTQTIALRPGQRIDIGTGTVLEAYDQQPTADTQTAFSELPLPRAGQESGASAPTSASESPTPMLAPSGIPPGAAVMEQNDALTKAARAAAAGAAPARP